MAFIVGKKNTRKIRVQIEVQGDFNEVEKQNLDVEFKIVSIGEAKAIEKLQDQNDEGHDTEAAANAVFDAIVSVEGLKDETGASLPYDDKTRQFLIDTLWTRYPIMRGFWSVQLGTSQAETYKTTKLKN